MKRHLFAILLISSSISCYAMTCGSFSFEGRECSNSTNETKGWLQENSIFSFDYYDWETGESLPSGGIMMISNVIVNNQCAQLRRDALIYGDSISYIHLFPGNIVTFSAPENYFIANIYVDSINIISHDSVITNFDVFSYTISSGDSQTRTLSIPILEETRWSNVELCFEQYDMPEKSITVILSRNGKKDTILARSPYILPQNEKCTCEDWSFSGWITDSVYDDTSAPMTWQTKVTDSCTVYAVYSFTKLINDIEKEISMTKNDYQWNGSKFYTQKEGVTIDFTNVNSFDQYINIQSNCTITVSSNRPMTKIKFQTAGMTGSNFYDAKSIYLYNSVGSYSPYGIIGTWTGNSKLVKFTSSYTKLNPNIEITQSASYYETTYSTSICENQTYTITTFATNGIVLGAGTYVYGTQVKLTAIPNEHYHFVQWSDGNIDNPRTIVVTEDIAITAMFERLSLTNSQNVPNRMKVSKFLHNGNLIIERNGIKYTATGQKVR